MEFFLAGWLLAAGGILRLDAPACPGRRALFGLLCTLFILAAARQPLRAQVEWRVTPRAGFYLPLGKLVEHDDVSGREDLEMWHVGSVVGGAQVSAARGDWELTVGSTYTPSLVAVRTLDGTRDVRSNLAATSVRVLWHPVEATARREWGVYAGPGLILLHRWGEAWQGIQGTGDVGGLLSVGTTLRLPELDPSTFRVGVTAHLYRSNFYDRRRGEFGDGLQPDLVMSAGFSLPVNN